MICDVKCLLLNTSTFIDMFRTCSLTTKEVMLLFENLSSDCCDTPVESSSDEEMPFEDPPVAPSSSFQNAKSIDSSSNADFKEQRVTKI
ncbi:hypothetical protein NPIL_67552 [Nephila pilipes]|uniref:Uncharacterized protein n=1 Tax=Nephila pilipes TaxID=299642 RepID=A0A8X6NKK6_NEPPI|nr:hypothetical protein NPIL_67552 [Nephila pilipes]